MKAEIIAVGTELLLGDIVNTNAQYIAKRLADIGVSVYHQTVVGDNPQRLKEALDLAFRRGVDVVITTGGLGPTKDDLTKEIAAEFFSKELAIHEESLNIIKEYFAKSKRTFSENNVKQAYFPKDSIILENNHGTAPGCIIEKDNNFIILLPGPPREMKPMFEGNVIPYLKKFTDGILVSKVLRICGLGESAMAEIIQDIIDKQTNPTVAPYAKSSEVTLRITAKASSEKEAEKLILPVEEEIRQRLGENVYGEGETSLEEVIGNALIEKGLTISTAESCTGGLLAGQLINYPGISKVFMEGAVTYSNEAKINRIKVKKSTLEAFGAVSGETAVEMAEGIAKTSKTNIGISTTGIAGPSGGTDKKPVGLVYIGLYINGDTKYKELNIKGDRNRVRERTVVTALDWLRREINKIK